MPQSRVIIGLVLATLLVSAAWLGNSSTPAHLNHQPAHQGCGPGESLPLTLMDPWRGDIQSGNRQCFKLELEQGGFVRLWIEADSGSLAAFVLPHGDSIPAMRVFVGGGGFLEQPGVLSWKAPASGAHRLVLETTDYSAALGVSVELRESQSAGLREAEERALAADPRVRWLTQHALPVRSISPNDNDFSDLEPLKSALRDAIEEGLDWLEENKRARSVERPLQPYEPAYKPNSEWQPVIQHSQHERRVEQSDGGVQKNGFIVPGSARPLERKTTLSKRRCVFRPI